MKKRVSTILATCIIILGTLSPCSASGEIEPYRASEYLLSYSALMTVPKTQTGTLEIVITVTPAGYMTSLGATSVKIYTEDGELVKSVTGTSSNGLLELHTSSRYINSYIFDEAISGESYYAEVTVYAGNSTGSDSRTLTTKVGTAN